LNKKSWSNAVSQSPRTWPMITSPLPLLCSSFPNDHHPNIKHDYLSSSSRRYRPLDETRPAIRLSSVRCPFPSPYFGLAPRSAADDSQQSKIHSGGVSGVIQALKDAGVTEDQMKTWNVLEVGGGPWFLSPFLPCPPVLWRSSPMLWLTHPSFHLAQAPVPSPHVCFLSSARST
jgi:hypothetical protein